VLAEDPPAFGEIYMLKYFQIFIYFILFSTRAKNASHCNTSAVHSLLDFLYLAQYPMHMTETLKLLCDALKQFHDNKGIFVDLGIHNDFHIPKLHFLDHYLMYIELYGTMDNCNTEYTECLHIDLAKDAWDATNGKDELPQMTLWLECHEKIFHHVKFINWQTGPQPNPLD
jgi:hypothetical protein